MKYELFLRREVFDFIAARRGRERQRFLAFLSEICRNPYKKGDFIQFDNTGREIEGVIIDRFAILYWADHAVKEVKIVEIRYADK
jgi:hypothetical protein